MSLKTRRWKIDKLLFDKRFLSIYNTVRYGIAREVKTTGLVQDRFHILLNVQKVGKKRRDRRYVACQVATESYVSAATTMDFNKYSLSTVNEKLYSLDKTSFSRQLSTSK